MSGNFLTIKEASDLAGKSEITIRRLIKLLTTQKENTSPLSPISKYNLSNEMISQMIRQDKQSDNPQSPFIYKISEDLIRQVFDLTTPTNTQTTPENTQPIIPPTQPITQEDTQTPTQEKNKASETNNDAKTTAQMPTQGDNQPPMQASSQDATLLSIIDFLKEQIKVKDEQTKDMSNKIDQLIERDRETNIILMKLQDKVFMLEGAKPKQTEPAETAEQVETKPEATEPAPAKPEEQTSGTGSAEPEQKPLKAGSFWKRLFN